MLEEESAPRSVRRSGGVKVGRWSVRRKTAVGEPSSYPPWREVDVIVSPAKRAGRLGAMTVSAEGTAKRLARQIMFKRRRMYALAFRRPNVALGPPPLRPLSFRRTWQRKWTSVRLSRSSSQRNRDEGTRGEAAFTPLSVFDQ